MPISHMHLVAIKETQSKDNARKTYLLQLRAGLYATLTNREWQVSLYWGPGQRGCIFLGLFCDLLLCQGQPVEPGLCGRLTEEVLQRFGLILLLKTKRTLRRCCELWYLHKVDSWASRKLENSTISQYSKPTYAPKTPLLLTCFSQQASRK